jgi:hypothetical protein
MIEDLNPVEGLQDLNPVEGCLRLLDGFYCFKEQVSYTGK